MALILKDRVKESSTSSGTGNITLGGAFPGYQTFNAAIASGSTVYYTIHNLTSGFDTEWEVGVGTFTSPATLVRNTVLSSSNSGSAVNFTAGASGLEVFVTQPAEEAIYLNQATGLVEIGGNGTNTVAFTNINTTNLTANTVTLTAGTITTNAANATDITNKTYVDNLFSTGITYHDPVLVESPIALIATYNQPGGAGNGVGATLTNSGANVALSIDGVSLSNTARVLVYQQSNAVQNGVYTVTNPGAPDAPGPGAAWVLTRATDADTYGVGDPNKLGQGDAFFVQSGNTGAGETYILNTVGTITFGTTNLTFAQISSAQVYSAGTGLNLTNLAFSISNTAVTAAQYGNDGAVGQFTVNAQGQITNAANVSINASSISVGTLANGRTTAASANGASTIVARDANGSFTANVITASTLSVAGGVTFSTTASNIDIGTSQSTPILRLGGISQTGTMTLGRSTANQTTDIQAGATLSGNTKTINLGTGGVSGSTTAINIGSANGTTVTVNGTTNLANVNVSGNVSVGGSVSGNGASLSAINASNISSGTIANARTTASEANGASTIVSRDSSGSFEVNLVNAVSLSGNAATVTNINASNIASGTIANARTTASSSNGASTIVLRGASGEFAAGAITGTSFSGNGSALTAINASAITTGTLDNARTNATSANGASTLVVRDANGSFAGNVITGTTGTFTSVSGNGVALTAINASNISSGTVPTARLATGTANASTYLRGDRTWVTLSTGNVSYDTATANTGYLALPSGTTAQRPGSPANGNTRFNTTLNAIETYSASSGRWEIVVYFTVPGAPTGVSAATAGATAATVTYSAPADTGIGTSTQAITSYTAVSSPGGITSTVSQSGSGTITVTGLTTGTAYTFVVYATNAAGNSANSAASNSVTPLALSSVEYLVVAGGGGGAPQAPDSCGGGGGAGGFRAGSLSVSLGVPYTVTVGGGGGAFGQGGDSVFSSITSAGGGYGANQNQGSTAGGSGGGGGLGGAGAAGNTPATSPSQGNAGGNAQGWVSGGQNGAGAGGGAGSVGGYGTSGIGGTGGDGASSSITGTATLYAGGGGGGSNNGGGPAGTGGGGKLGVPGTANTGGGGGGGSQGQGGVTSGGSGVVVVRYPNSFSNATSTTGTVTFNNTGGYKIYRWTSSGSITF